MTLRPPRLRTGGRWNGLSHAVRSAGRQGWARPGPPGGRVGGRLDAVLGTAACTAAGRGAPSPARRRRLQIVDRGRGSTMAMAKWRVAWAGTPVQRSRDLHATGFPAHPQADPRAGASGLVVHAADDAGHCQHRASALEHRLRADPRSPGRRIHRQADARIAVWLAGSSCTTWLRNRWRCDQADDDDPATAQTATLPAFLRRSAARGRRTSSPRRGERSVIPEVGTAFGPGAERFGGGGTAGCILGLSARAAARAFHRRPAGTFASSTK